MSDSVLTSMKATLNLDNADESFDIEIVVFINALLSELNAIGIGPAYGFEIADETKTWTEFLGDEMRINMAKSWMYLRLRLIFDPPETGPLTTAIENQATRAYWYLSTFREVQIAPYEPEVLPEIDGGDAEDWE